MSKTRYLIIDWAAVDGIDYTGVGRILELIKLVRSHDIQPVFTALSLKLQTKLQREGVMSYLAGTYATLDLGAEWVEDRILSSAAKVCNDFV